VIRNGRSEWQHEARILKQPGEKKKKHGQQHLRNSYSSSRGFSFLEKAEGRNSIWI